MTAEPPTRLIERQRLSALIESSRANDGLAHTVRRRRNADQRGSALRGLAMVVVATLIVRALIGWLFF